VLSASATPVLAASSNSNPFLITRSGGGGDSFTSATTGTDFGTINSGTTWLLEGGEITSFSDGGDVKQGGFLNYSVYRSSQSRPDFAELSLPFNSNPGANQDKWQKSDLGLSLTGDLVQILGATYNGTYNIDYYFRAWFNWGSQYNYSGTSTATTPPTSNFYTATYTLSGFDYYLDGSSGTTTQSTVTGGAATLTGSVGIGKFGGGTTELTATGNDYTGRTLVAAGTLKTTAAGVVPDGSDVYIKSGATFDLNGNTETVASVREYGVDDGGTVSLGSGTLIVNGSDRGNISQNSIGGTGGNVTFSSSGTTYYLYGTQDYTGTTTVTAGTVQTSVGMSSTAFVINGGTFETLGANQISDTATMTLGGGTLKIGGSETFGNNGVTLTASTTSTVSPTSGNTATITGALTGSGNLTKADNGTVILSGNSTGFSGNTTVSAGVLRVAHSSALGASGAVAVSANAALQLSNSVTIGRNLTLNGDGVTAGSGALRSVSGDNIWSGGISNNSGGRINVDDGTLTVQGNITNANNQTLYVGGDGNTTIGGTITGDKTTGDGALFKNGAGVLTITNNNTGLSGNTIVNAGAMLLGNNNALGTSGTNFVTAGAALQLSNNISVGSKALTLNGGGLNDDGALRNVSGDNSWAGNITLASNARIAADENTTLSINNVNISQAANRSVTFSGAGTTVVQGLIQTDGTSLTNRLIKEGVGTLVISNATGQAGSQLRLGQGTVLLAQGTFSTNTSTVTRAIDLGLSGASTGETTTDNAAFLVKTDITVSNSIYVAPNTVGESANATRTIGLVEAGSATFNNEIFLGGTLTMDAAANGNLTVSGNLTNVGGIIKTGEGTVTLSGANTHAGATTVAGGTLRISGNNRLGNTGTTLTISNAGILEVTATGTITNAITIGDGNGVLSNASGGLLVFSGGASKDGTVLTSHAGSGTNVFTGVISGDSEDSDFVVDGGTTVFSNVMTYNGPTIITNGGTLVLGTNNAMPSGSDLILGGGTFRVGVENYNTADPALVFGSLTLTENSTIDFGIFEGGVRRLSFADSSGVAINWNSNAVLTITNWEGVAATQSDVTKLLFGTGGLDTDQLAQIQFAGYQQGAVLVSGELVPVPEPRVYAAAVALLVAVGWRERKRLIGLVRRKSPRA
jgi:autotransporter-associated beta strand protein